MIVEIGTVLVSTDLFTEFFCCDLAICKGRCCVEGASGAPVTLDEIASLESAAERLSEYLSPAAQGVIDRQGVAYADCEGDLVTSIVGDKECVFSFFEDNPLADDGTPCCYCLLERAFREGLTASEKPISCALYPLREKLLSNGQIGLTYERIPLCAAGRAKGARLHIPLYTFLRPVLCRRFGEAWVTEADDVAQHLPRTH